MPMLCDLKIVDEYRDALPKPTEAERKGLESMISEAGGCILPILYHMDPDGDLCIVDGYTRLDIFTKNPRMFEEEPPLKEVIELSGASEEEVIEWIRRHQVFRRNNESLMSLYQLGVASEGKSIAQSAEDYNSTKGKVRSAKSLRESVDKLDEQEPGLREQILESEVPASAVKQAAESGDVEPLKEMISAGNKRSPRKELHPGARFHKMSSSLKQIAREAGAIENETTPNQWSEEVKRLVNQLGKAIEQWAEAELYTEG